jgi:CIC family chloride channel protein
LIAALRRHTGVVGAAFHLVVAAHGRSVVERMGPGWLTIAAAAGIAALGIVLAFLLTHHIAPEAAGSGVPEVEGALEGLREVRWRRVLPVKFLGGVLGLSSGLVAGREGPAIGLGAAIGAALAERLKLDRMDLHTLLAAGARGRPRRRLQPPLAAVLFVIEETRKRFRYTFRSYVAVILASAASAFGMELVGGTAPPLKIATAAMPLLLLPVFMVLGVLLGALGVLFNRCLIMALDWRAAAFKRAPFVYALLVGAVVGMLAIVMPLAVGGGDTLIPRMAVSDLPILALLLIAAMRFIGTMASYPVGVPAHLLAHVDPGHRGRPGRRRAVRGRAAGGLAARAAFDRRRLRRSGDGRAVHGHHPRAAGRRRAGGRADRRLRADPAHHRHLRDRPCGRRGAARPADLRGAARTHPAVGRPGAAAALDFCLIAGRDRRENRNRQALSG